jgi:hypothetical protein
MELRLEHYDEKYKHKWDTFVLESSNGTIFHTQEFLSYHKAKYDKDIHQLIWFKGESIFAVLPMAIKLVDDHKLAISPYGASFGGIVFNDKINLKYSEELVESLIEYCKSQKINSIKLTLTPNIYASLKQQYIEYSLSKHNFKIISRDLFNVLPIPQNYDVIWNELYAGRVRTSIRKSRDNFEIISNASVDEFYPILLEDKQRHNNSIPTHTLDELINIKNKHVDDVIIDLGISKSNGAKVGVCYFKCTKEITMTFYISQSNQALRQDGASVLIDYGINRAICEGVKYIDFGGSTLGYTIQNFGVSNFKEGFGALAELRNTYRLDL